jgi:hypothetical protein
MLELTINYAYDKRTNSIDVEIAQSPITKTYYESNPIFKIKDIDYDFLDKVGKKIGVVDFRTRPARYFDVNINLTIFQTNGIEIMRESHQIRLENEKESITQNFPLIAKIRRIPIKKREQEFIQELISNTAISKLYQTEEIEKILTQNSIMWVKADPDITLIRQIKISQQHIIYEYIKLFKEGDIVGQYETLKNIFESVENHSNSLQILETFIRSNNNYKLRQYALKLYVKIILKNKIEDGYLFLLEFLEDCYTEILKNKTLLNRDAYFLLKKIIKYLGDYKEENFNEFVIIGRVKTSSIQNKIIDKFLTILISNDLNIINGFNDAYIMRQILIGCSKLNLQDKTFFLLKKIVKCLRIEKLKRSFNEIIIISSIEAFLSVLVKNDFFKYNRQNNNCKLLVEEIFNEINYFINSDCENYELKVFLSYFQIYLIFYKSLTFTEFCSNVLSLMLPDKMNIDGDNTNYSDDILNENILPIYFSVLTLLESINLKFESKDDKLSCINFIKEILFSKYAYYRTDLRITAEKLFNLIMLKPCNEFCPSHNYNKNSINFGSKKYADEEWLYSFAKDDERKDRGDNNVDGKFMPNEIESSETQSRQGTKQYSLLKKYQMKYPLDIYVMSNYSLDLEKK